MYTILLNADEDDIYIYQDRANVMPIKTNVCVMILLSESLLLICSSTTPLYFFVFFRKISKKLSVHIFFTINEIKMKTII